MQGVRFPDFLGIGAQKAGTTWLDANLRRHPDIWMPWIKELQYFNELYIPGHRAWTARHRTERAQRALRGHLNATFAKGRDPDLHLLHGIAEVGIGPISDAWYGRIFAHAGHDQICGEITPEYGLLPRAGIAHLRRLNPNARIILLLRDPIERNWSHIRMMARKTPGLDLLAATEMADVRARADYPRMIGDWRRALGERNLHIDTLDAIGREPFAVLERVCAFLGVPYDGKHFPRAEEHVHEGEAIEIPPAVHARLKQQLRPVYEGLARLFPDLAETWMARHWGG